MLVLKELTLLVIAPPMVAGMPDKSLKPDKPSVAHFEINSPRLRPEEANTEFFFVMNLFDWFIMIILFVCLKSNKRFAPSPMILKSFLFSAQNTFVIYKKQRRIFL